MLVKAFAGNSIFFNFLILGYSQHNYVKTGWLEINGSQAQSHAVVLGMIEPV